MNRPKLDPEAYKEFVASLPEVEATIVHGSYSPETWDMSGDPAICSYLRAQGIDPRMATTVQACRAMNAVGDVSGGVLTVAADGRSLDFDMRMKSSDSVIRVLGGTHRERLGFFSTRQGAMSGKTTFVQQHDYSAIEMGIGARFFHDEIRRADAQYMRDRWLSAWPEGYKYILNLPHDWPKSLADRILDFSKETRAFERFNAILLDPRDDESFAWYEPPTYPSTIRMSGVHVSTIVLATRGEELRALSRV
jgi:hypothetical protein